METETDPLKTLKPGGACQLGEYTVSTEWMSNSEKYRVTLQDVYADVVFIGDYARFRDIRRAVNNFINRNQRN